MTKVNPHLTSKYKTGCYLGLLAQFEYVLDVKNWQNVHTTLQYEYVHWIWIFDVDQLLNQQLIISAKSQTNI